MMEDEGLRTLAKRFFKDLSGFTAECDAPPEASDQMIRVKLSTGPWVIPTLVDRRISAQEIMVPRLHPVAAASPTLSSPSHEGNTNKWLSGGPQLDPYVAFHAPSHDAGKFDLSVRIIEDAAISPILPPPPSTSTSVSPAKPQTPLPVRPQGAPTLNKQIFLKSPLPDTSKPGLTSLLFSPHFTQQPPKAPEPTPRSILTPKPLPSGFLQPPSATRKRVTFVGSAEEITPLASRET